MRSTQPVSNVESTRTMAGCRAHRRGRFVIGLGLCALAAMGCYSYPYQPQYYNHGPYTPAPSMGPSYVPPGGYMAPGGTYTPGGPSLGAPSFAPSSPSPTPISPSPTQQTPTFRPDPNNGLDPQSNAPPFRPAPGNNNSVVPDPMEPDFGAPPGAAAIPRAVPLASARPFSPIEVTSVSQPSEADPFAPNDTPMRSVSQEPNLQPAGRAPTPYGFDDKTYTWLRGIVDFDEDTQTWSIIYNLTPDIDDRFGGSFVFAPHDGLKGLRPGDLVLAKGRVDPGRKDRTGKALYEVAQIVHLAPPDGPR